MWAAAAVPPAFASYVMRAVDGAEIDGKALCALTFSQATDLLERAAINATPCPMSPVEAAEVGFLLFLR